MNKNELLDALNEDYELIKSLQRKGLSIHNELQEEISEFEKQYIIEYVLPELKSKAEELLTILKCKVCIGINMDINGAVNVENKSNSVMQTNNAQEKSSEKKMSAITSNPSCHAGSNIENDSEQKKDKHITRGARKRFKVIFNGELVPGNDGATILANAIRLIGFRRVASMGIMFDNGEYNLVDRKKRIDNNQVWQRQIDDWYVYTNMQNVMKIGILRKIAETQNLDLQVIEEF